VLLPIELLVNASREGAASLITMAFKAVKEKELKKKLFVPC
jgi:hypothetical protein